MEQKREFTSLEDVFAALSREVQEHSLRVEQYAELIFKELVASEEYTGNVRSRVRLKKENRSVVCTAARYHDVGKALVPAYYQWEQESYSAEETALYRKHCLAGSELVNQLLRDKKTMTAAQVEVITESIAYHHENWDGEGFPGQTAQEATPVVGRIVAVADQMDHLLMNTYSENPVSTVIDRMMEDSGSIYDPVIMGLLYEVKHKVERIFVQYRGQSKAVAKAPRVIRRKAKRPMWLQYRPLTDLQTNAIATLEADMQFRRGKEIVELAQVEHLIRESKSMQQLGMGFVLEACDMGRRMAACKVGGEFVALNCVPGFLRKRGMANALGKQITDTDSDPAMLCIIVGAEDAVEPSSTVIDNCSKLRSLGCRIMVSGLPLEKLDMGMLQQLRVTHLRLAPQDLERLEEYAPLLQTIGRRDIVIFGDGVERHKHIEQLLAQNIRIATGNLMGEYIGEDQLITTELAMRKD